MKKLYIIVPSRGGRDSWRGMVNSWLATKGERSELIIAIDRDEVDKYPLLFSEPHMGVNVVVLDKRYFLAPKLNTVCNGIVNGDFGINPLGVGYVADDCMFRTDNWEHRIINQLEKERGMVYCNDLLQKEFLPNNIFIHTDIIKTLGFMCPRTLTHFYIDNYWKDLGLRTGLIYYFPQIIIEHMHWGAEKGKKDALHEEMKDMIYTDHDAYDKYVITGNLAADAEKILAGKEE